MKVTRGWAVPQMCHFSILILLKHRHSRRHSEKNYFISVSLAGSETGGFPTGMQAIKRNMGSLTIPNWGLCFTRQTGIQRWGHGRRCSRGFLALASLVDEWDGCIQTKLSCIMQHFTLPQRSVVGVLVRVSFHLVC